MTDGENVLDRPVEREGRGIVVAEKEEHQRHEHHDALLHFITGFRHHRHLDHAGRGHDDGENVDRDTGEYGESIGLGKVVDPEERLATELNGVIEHAEEAEEDGDLNQHRQAATEWVDAVFAVEPHHLGVELCGVVFVFFLQFGHLRLEFGHAFHRASRFRV